MFLHAETEQVAAGELSALARVIVLEGKDLSVFVGTEGFEFIWSERSHRSHIGVGKLGD